MQRNIIVCFLLIGLVFTACSASEDEIVTPAVPTTPIVIATLPAPQVIVEITQTPSPAPTTTIEPSRPPTARATETLPPTEQILPTPTIEPSNPVSSISLEPVISEGLVQVTYLTHAYDERLFVLEKIGRIRIIENGLLVEQPFLDISDRVGSVSSEQGLLGLAFHPDYATDGAPNEGNFYVNYTDYSGNTHISRFSVLENDPDRADPNSEVIYLTQIQPFPNHNGGSLAFGPDGYLYAGLGDGGSANDPLGAGQDLSTLLGKILRLDVDSTPDEYAIPPDNPFVSVDGAQPEIWAYGLRNPWRISFDRATGDLYIADVGQNQWEEVNFQSDGSVGGENYGWRIMEGTHCFEAETCGQQDLVLPVFEYDHSMGCSITGGYVYRGNLFPAMTGNYFVSDYCTGTIWRLIPDGDNWLADVVLESDLIISSFGEDVNGEIYVTNYWSGGIFRIVSGG